jgi:hypothetical protein
VDAKPWLAEVGRHLAEVGLEAVLIGNAAAALQGAPVTTVELDFAFRRTPANIRKLKQLATRLEAILLKPYYPVSDLFRLVRDDDGLQVDLMGTIHGIRSSAGLQKRATAVRIASSELRVASLDDVIRSKRAAARPRDLAVLPILEKAREEAR